MIIELESDFIRLDQLLKLADLVDSGGMAKFFIQEGLVRVNRELVRERGRKIYPGDLVEVQSPQDASRVRIKLAARF